MTERNIMRMLAGVTLKYCLSISDLDKQLRLFCLVARLWQRGCRLAIIAESEFYGNELETSDDRGSTKDFRMAGEVGCDGANDGTARLPRLSGAGLR